MTLAQRATCVVALCSALAVLSTAPIAGLPAAQAAVGGVSTYSPPASTETEAPTAAGKAMLVNGRAIAPVDAPPAVKKVIAAANKIRTKPYIYGGGHARWWDSGYDCSGAVSFALRGGKFLTSPMPSGPMASWGTPGAGRWITVYANGGHAYAIIAGLRWDTAGNTNGTGPRWHEDLDAAASGPFVARHPTGY
ncbi:MAG: C40 family peptidase [Thermoleophilia bacterium]|nr:C40 family peptidase [Thermoleophilia bacterium]